MLKVVMTKPYQALKIKGFFLNFYHKEAGDKLTNIILMVFKLIKFIQCPQFQLKTTCP